MDCKKMMLDHFGEEELGSTLLDVVESVTRDGFLTPDIGGKHTTKEVTDEIINRLKAVDKKRALHLKVLAFLNFFNRNLS
ncbi:hypothetical protein GCM10020331_005990 [Ectobacillus funiculus]